MTLKHLITVTILYLALFSTSCTSESCDEPTEALLNMSVQLSENSEATAVDSITIYGIDIPENLLYDTITSSMVTLPLSPSTGYVRFAVRRGSVLDTIGIEYTSETRFISKPCGYTFFYKIKNITFTDNSIDNIIIINQEISPGDAENLRTFF